MAKLTFKNEPPVTGLAGVGYSPGATIKRKGKQVGIVSAPHWSSTEHVYKIMLLIKKEAAWHWITLKHKAVSLDAAKQFVKTNDEAIQKKYDLYEMEI